MNVRKNKGNRLHTNIPRDMINSNKKAVWVMRHLNDGHDKTHLAFGHESGNLCGHRILVMTLNALIFLM